jgi:hypothetical protein
MPKSKPKQSYKSKLSEGWTIGFWLIPGFWLAVVVGAGVLLWFR